MSKSEKQEEQFVREYLEYDGFIKKKNFGKGLYKDRYFVFGPNGYSLFYYVSKGKSRPKSDDQPKGWILIHKCIISLSESNQQEFVIENQNGFKQKKWLIQCQNSDEKDRWVRMLNFFKNRNQRLLNQGDMMLLSLVQFENKGNKLEDFDDIEVLKQMHLMNEKRNIKYLERWEEENQKVLKSLNLEFHINQHSDFSKYIHYGFLFRKQKFEDLKDKAGNLLKQSEQLWFLLISEIPLFDEDDFIYDMDENKSDESFEDQAIMEEDIPQGMEQNVLYIFEVNDGGKGTFTSKMVDKLMVEDIIEISEAVYKKNGNVLEEFGQDFAKTIKKGVGTVINTFSTLFMFDRLIGLKINIDDLKYKFILKYFDNFKEEEQFEKYELCSISFLQVTEWYEKLNKLTTYLKEKQIKKQFRIEQRKQLKELIKCPDSDEEYKSDSSSEIDPELEVCNSFKKQIIKQDILDLISIDRVGVKPKLSFNPLKNLRRLQQLGVDFARELANKAQQLVNQDRMAVLKREALGIHRDKNINRIEEENIQLQEIQNIQPFKSKRMIIKYGIEGVYQTTVEIRCKDTEDRDEWIFLITSLQNDMKDMKLTVNELFPNNKQLRNIVKYQLFGKKPLCQILQKSQIDKKSSDKQQQQAAEEEKLQDNSTTISRNSSLYTRYYYYDSKMQSGEEFKYDQQIISDINDKPQKKKRKGKKLQEKTFWQKVFPCCYNNDQKQKDEKNKKNKNNIKEPLMNENSTL